MDSFISSDSMPLARDSSGLVLARYPMSKRPVQMGSVWWPVDTILLKVQILNHHPYFDFEKAAKSIKSERWKFQGKELLFYVVLALWLIFAFLKSGFSKYFNDLFRVFFRTTLKQRQIREQLIQNPFPSLLFNVFFVASAGLYATLLLRYYEMDPVGNFWLLYLYCAGAIALVYFVKYLGLKIFGWLFRISKAADAYIFVVFIINKVLGIALLPFLVFLSFSDDAALTVSLILSWCCIGGLFLYRFILGYSAIHNEVRFNLFHFFLYLCAFEIAPLLLIYRLLLFFF